MYGRPCENPFLYLVPPLQVESCMYKDAALLNARKTANLLLNVSCEVPNITLDLT